MKVIQVMKMEIKSMKNKKPQVKLVKILLKKNIVTIEN